MLITNPAVRATLAEVLSHPWMVLGFNGPPDPHMLRREPLRADELDRQVIRGMTGFEFGSEQDIEKKLVAILESEEYIRAVQHWERKRSIGGHLNGHGKEGSRWGDLSNSSLSLSFDGNTSSRGDPPTPSKKSKRFSGFDFYRRKLFSSMSTPPISPMAYSPSNSQNHLSHPSVNEPNREPLDPTSGYHPLLSMYYLAREKLERELVYGPGQFASSQLSIQDPSGAASPASIPKSPGDGGTSTSGVSIQINGSSAKQKKEPPLPPPAGNKADYNMALPRLPAPETLHYSGTSYDNANASPISPAFGSPHPQPRARDPGLPPPTPPPPTPLSGQQGPGVESQTIKAGRTLPRAPPASTHRRSHSMSQRPSGLVRGWSGMFGGGGAEKDKVDEHGVPVPKTAGPEMVTFSEKLEEAMGPEKKEEGERERESSHTLGGGALSAGATLVRKFGSMLVGGGKSGGGNEESRRHAHQGTVGKGTASVAVTASSPRPSEDAEVKKVEEEGVSGGDQQRSGEEKEKDEQVMHVHIQTPPPTGRSITHSLSQPVGSVHRRSATLQDPHGRAQKHSRRSSTSAAYATETTGTAGRHRRPSTGYGSMTKPLADRLFGRTEPPVDVAESREEEDAGEQKSTGTNLDQDAEDTYKEDDGGQNHDKDFKPVFLKGLFRYT